MCRLKSNIFLYLVAILAFGACRNSVTKTTETVNLAISESPETLFPYFAKSTIAGQISSKLYLPMADFNAKTLELEPVLLESIPTPVIDSAGEKYQFKLLKNASWSDGRPITANDVLFTLKMIMNPFHNYGSVRSTLVNITQLSTPDPTSKEFTVVFSGKYHLDLEAFTNLPLLPAHFIDPNNEMAQFSWNALIHYADSLDNTKDSMALAKVSNQANFLKDDFTKHVGSGPYVVSEWSPNQRLTLIKVEKYWGEDQAASNIDFQAMPLKINYLIFPEESTALAALKSGQIDIMPDVKDETVDLIKNDQVLAKNFNVVSSDVLQYYYIGMNNKGALLHDVNIRKALAHLVNVDQIIETLVGGNADRVKSPILHQKPYYVPNLPLVEFNPNKAVELLKKSGYSTMGSDGIRQKVVNNKSQRLTFTILTTGKQLGKDVATLLKNEAQKVGVEIKIEILDFPKILERVKAGNYDLANLVVKQFPGLDDPYIGWNSFNAYGRGSNYCNVVDPEIDRITEAIRITTNANDRNRLYQEFQIKLVALQPVIFLFSPKNNIVIKDGLTMVTSAKRPGYFENTVHSH
jgi:ABC-type transport system substrate-binding protein